MKIGRHKGFSVVYFYSFRGVELGGLPTVLRTCNRFGQAPTSTMGKGPAAWREADLYLYPAWVAKATGGNSEGEKRCNRSWVFLLGSLLLLRELVGKVTNKSLAEVRDAARTSYGQSRRTCLRSIAVQSRGMM